MTRGSRGHWLPFGLALALVGCAASHEQDGGAGSDAAGSDGSARRDGGLGADAGDLPLLPPHEVRCDLDPSETPCGRVGCYPRCCEPGPADCPGDFWCGYPGLCIPWFDAQYPCEFYSAAIKYCPRGGPCAGRTSSDGSFGGSCVDVDLCLAAAEEGADFECRWYDGSRVVNGPPPGTCPPQNPQDPFCGGVCPEIDCARAVLPFGWTSVVPDCVGLSERRAFGVCRLRGEVCRRPADGPRPPDDSECIRNYGEPCACMRLAEQLETGREDEAVFVTASACRTYREHYPDSVECMDIGWNPLD